MKYSARDAAAAVNNPKALPHAVLLYGPEADLVTERQGVLLAELRRMGEDGDLRLLDKTEARKDPALVADARMETGLFGGRPILLIEGVGDAFSKSLATILDQTTDNAGWLLLTAANLPPKSSLRQLAEAHPQIACLPCYDDSSPAERVETALRRHQLPPFEPEAMNLFIERMGTADQGSIDQCLIKLSLWLGQPLPSRVTTADIDSVTPPTGDAESDALITAILSGNVGSIPQLMLQLQAQGQSAAGLLAVLGWQFRRFHGLMVLAARSNLDTALAAQRPPLAMKQKRLLERAGRIWTLPMIEQGLRLIAETEAQLRSGLAYPEEALVERCLIRMTAPMARR